MPIVLERENGVSTFRQEEPHPGEANKHKLLSEGLRCGGLSEEDAEKIRTNPELMAEAVAAMRRIATRKNGWNSRPLTEHPLFARTGKNK